ncbi:hypothetical protein MANES_11G092050v8 [Manihot esculenta]|uniref:Uncharacterized protein n=1 Tax=Manihot esculenta TaxID=3983 RepID=A0ACB7GUB5_MANES|nr:hypothetical protein MANES_11G092050v8 [Manihot esculenta]
MNEKQKSRNEKLDDYLRIFFSEARERKGESEFTGSVIVNFMIHNNGLEIITSSTTTYVYSPLKQERDKKRAS